MQGKRLACAARHGSSAWARLSLGRGRLRARCDRRGPQRNVQIVVPYTPGTAADILARLLGPRLAERWKVGVVTENRAGATGNIGTAFVAKAPPDGHTLLFVATSFAMIPAVHQKLPFDPIKSFRLWC